MQAHPDEQLEAYVLHALDEGEMVRVEAHLGGCAQCRLLISSLEQTAALLGGSVDRLDPPAMLLTNILDAIEPREAVLIPTVGGKAGDWYGSRVVRVFLPVAAVIVVGLFTLSVLMNLRISDRTEVLEDENARLAAQMAQTIEDGSQMAETVEQLRVTSYWLANPSNSSMTLRPPDGASSSRGVLLVSSSGERAVLLLAGMSDSSLHPIYQVWLLRRGERVWAGEVEVDDGGWGTVTLLPNESLYRFDKVELTAERTSGGPANTVNMVLQGDIPGPKPSEKLDFSDQVH